MQIAIEGLDGVGKTSTAKALAERLHGVYFSKAFHLMRDTSGVYDTFTSVAECGRSEASARSSYGVRSAFLYAKLSGIPVVTERYYCTNYASKPEQNTLDEIYWNMDYFGRPDLTFLLYCDPETNYQRMYGRNPNDKDFWKLKEHKAFYERLLAAAQKLGLHYKFLDTTRLSLPQVVDALMDLVQSSGSPSELQPPSYCWQVKGNQLSMGRSHGYFSYNAISDRDLPNVEQLLISAETEQVPASVLGKLPNLKQIHVDCDHKQYASFDGALFSKDGSRLIRVPAACDRTSYVVPASVRQIQYNAFQDCRLQTIEIDDNCVDIGYIAFWGCEKLKRLSLGKHTENIGRMAFIGCKSLVQIETKNTSFSFEAGILRNDAGDIVAAFDAPCASVRSRRIPAWSFARNQSIGHLEIGPEVERIGPYAFADSSLEVLDVQSPVEINDYAFLNCRRLRCLFFHSKTVPRIAHELLYHVGHHVDVIIPSGMMNVYQAAFKNCAEDVVIKEYDKQQIMEM